MINAKCFNRTTKYTRMITRIKHPSPVQATPFYSGSEIEDDIDLNNLKIDSLNICRFPLSSIASQYLANYILAFQPDILIFQEVKDKYALATVFQCVNDFCSDFFYHWWFSPNRVYRSHQCILYKDSLAHCINSYSLDPDYYYDPLYVLRPPIVSDFYICDDLIRLINIHGAPYGCKYETEKKAKFFDRLSDYIDSINSKIPTIIFGDFNVNFSGIMSYFNSNITKIPFPGSYNGIDYAVKSSQFDFLLSHFLTAQDSMRSDIEATEDYPDWLTDFSDHFPIRLFLSRIT